MTAYLLTIENVSDEKLTAYSYGDVDLIAYVARKALADATGDVSARITEVDEFGGKETRVVTSVSGDSETVGYVVRKKLGQERKAAGTVTEATEADPFAADASAENQ